MRIALATSHTYRNLTGDDRLMVQPLRDLAIECEPVIWDSPEVDWPSYEAVILRSCWDYHLRLSEFLAWIDRLDSLQVPLFNSPSVVRWNSDKRYLIDLRNHGVTIAPTVWLESGTEVNLRDIMTQKGWQQAIVKPTVSATAYKTQLVTPANLDEANRQLTEMLESSAMMVQAFISEVQQFGEWSLIFFAGEFSHGCVKKPNDGDFRVQEDFGGRVIEEIPVARMVEHAAMILDSAPGPTLYARVDAIEVKDRLVLMELELIEPMLFLGSDPNAPGRFAQAIAENCVKN